MKRSELKPNGTVEKFNELLIRDIERLKLSTSDTEDIACPVCDSRVRSLYGQKYGFFLSRCSECSMVYVNPRPTQNSLVRFYRDSTASAYFQEHIIRATEQHRFLRIVKPRLEYITQVVPIKGAWLDIGCSTGMLLSEGRGLGWDVHGIEFEPGSISQARKNGITIYDSPIEKLSLNNSFELITMFEVLEHVGSPLDTLTACYHANKANGYIVITVPNIDGVEFNVLGVGHSNVCPPGHLNYFSPETLSNILNRVGYEIVHCATPGKLDVDNMRSHFHKNKLSTGSDFLDKIILSNDPDSESLRLDLQRLIENSGSSGHLRVVAIKRVS